MKSIEGMTPPLISAEIMTEHMTYQKPTERPDVVSDFIMKWGLPIMGVIVAVGLIIGAWIWEL